MRMKNVVIFFVVLIVLAGIGFGGVKLYNLASNDKYWDNGSDSGDKKEVLSVEKDDDSSNVKNKKEENSSKKEDTKTNNKSKKPDNDSSSVDTTKGLDVEKNKEEVITYYKSLNCEEEEHEDGVKIYVNYRGDFLATKYQTFSKDTELSYSIVEMKVSVDGYDELTEAEKKEIDKAIRDEGDEISGYSLNISHDNSWIIYTWKGNKSSFLKTFDDFGNNKVSYTNYERYFNREGITCRES